MSGDASLTPKKKDLNANDILFFYVTRLPGVKGFTYCQAAFFLCTWVFFRILVKKKYWFG